MHHCMVTKYYTDTAEGDPRLSEKMSLQRVAEGPLFRMSQAHHSTKHPCATTCICCRLRAQLNPVTQHTVIQAIELKIEPPEPTPQDKLLLLRRTDIKRYYKSSPYYLEATDAAAAQKRNAAGADEVERYSDRWAPFCTAAGALGKSLHGSHSGCCTIWQSVLASKWLTDVGRHNMVWSQLAPWIRHAVG